MKSFTTPEFWACYHKLPDEIKKQAKRAYAQFAKDPYYPGLNFKRVHSSLPIYSARITSDYRIVGIIESGDIIWFWIGSHSSYDKLLKQYKKSQK